MSGIFGEAAAAMQRAAEEAAARERERRRRHLQNQIDEWIGKLSVVNKQISGLEKEKENLETYLGEWEEQKKKCNGNDVLSEIVIADLFEGVCADNIKDDFAEAVVLMDRLYSGGNAMKGDVDTQIAGLRRQESQFNAKLKSLRDELNSI